MLKSEKAFLSTIKILKLACIGLGHKNHCPERSAKIRLGCLKTSKSAKASELSRKTAKSAKLRFFSINTDPYNSQTFTPLRFCADETRLTQKNNISKKIYLLIFVRLNIKNSWFLMAGIQIIFISVSTFIMPNKPIGSQAKGYEAVISTIQPVNHTAKWHIIR